MKTPIKRISQVGVVVADLDKAMAAFAEDFGVTEWGVFEANEVFGDLIVNGEPGKLNIRGAITKELDGFEIELVQPIGPGPYMDHLKEHGPGVHHFAIILPDNNAQYQDVLERERQAGRKIWQEAMMVNGVPGEKLHFAYIDRRDDMGVIMEVYNENRE